MESRLPKPSSIKRPAMPVKSILPSDRIKAGGAGAFNANQTYCGNLLPPLSRDINNLPQVMERRMGGRAASPEPTKIGNRAKLRRSRSACDINEMRLNNKRTAAQPTLPSIPSKVSRFGNATATVPGQRMGRLAGTATTTATATATTTASTVTKRPLAARPLPRAATTAAASATATRAKPATGGGGGGASGAAPKRIAPYDFKARFHDLLDKHKVLKTKYEKQVEDMGELESLPTQLEETQTKLIETESSLKNVQTDNDCLNRQVKQQAKNIETITTSLGRAKEELSELQTNHKQIKMEHESLTAEVLQLRQRTEDLLRSNEQQAKDLETCKEQLFQSNMERKELHNLVMDLRGNIRVFCRIRPPLPSELDRNRCTYIYHDEATVELQSMDGQAKNKMGQQIFSFDQVFYPTSTQTDIFEMVSPLIQSALDGYNICIFAYGQTGSGKTYTMDGVPSELGVIPRTVDLLFDSIKGYRNLGWEYEIKATFLEIYNEVLYDLLSNEQKDMEIRMAKNNKNDIYVSNITEETVADPHHLRQLMLMARQNRATASTAGNERSSRSHAVTKLQLIGRHAEKQEVSVGSINLVDLAGSESPKTSIRMTETKSINRSLSELTNVILALLQKQDHIPYRNSKLTHLLMPSLGGNSKTLMFINVSPFQDCFQESVKSLRFAASVHSCKIPKAKRNRYMASSNTVPALNSSNSLGSSSNMSSSFDK
ncbi:protein claret segregational isoform X1 [Drosophila subobscura]|uniref:protein claret segregational isoform X1 n=1 Tax=Drosophila subobscura TaxID=7241 RepID=UPI00155B1143|nr:protein claret segregational isoform X1 [Drosophila subobscura]